MIEVIFRLAHLFGVEAIIPWRDCDVVGIGDGLHVGHFFFDAGGSSRPDLHHQVHRLVRVLRHRVGHAVMGMGRETEDFGTLLTQFQYFCDGRVGVVRILVIAAHRERTPDLFTQIAPR